ncbi:MAG: sensor histidine kinase [Thermomicrobiales bacterium]
MEPGPITRVLADPELIGQVLRNLLGNALKHTPPGTLVTLRASRANGRVRIEVADEGPGIHQDDLPRIFKKFGRGHDAQGHRRAGMGLGLYLSRRIIEVHGGGLIVETEIGRGTTFSFELEEVT